MDFLKTTWEALAALLMPIIILGGIYGGIFTPTEAASVAVLYALIVGFFIYKDLNILKIPKMLVDSIETSAMVCFIIATANLLSWVMTVLNMQQIVTTFLCSFIHNKVTYLLVLNLFLFFVGALMDNITTILLFAPVLVPIGLQFGIDPLHLGVLFVINLTIGFVTPPFGYNLFTACSITGLKFDRLIRGVFPFLLVEMAAVLVLAYVPWMITWLPSALS